MNGFDLSMMKILKSFRFSKGSTVVNFEVIFEPINQDNVLTLLLKKHVIEEE